MLIFLIFLVLLNILNIFITQKNANNDIARGIAVFENIFVIVCSVLVFLVIASLRIFL